MIGSTARAGNGRRGGVGGLEIGVLHQPERWRETGSVSTPSCERVWTPRVDTFDREAFNLECKRVRFL